jgi:hypothetical protein
MEATDTPEPYQVVVSADVRQRIRELHAQATARGDGPAFLAAVKKFMATLAVYPQFGDPIIDLTQGEGHIRVGIIRPISMRYGVHEGRRIVFCGALPTLLPMDRPDDSEAGGERAAE